MYQRVYIWTNRKYKGDKVLVKKVELMMLTQNINLRTEPHLIKVKDFEEGNPFVQEIINTGIKVA